MSRGNHHRHSWLIGTPFPLRGSQLPSPLLSGLKVHPHPQVPRIRVLPIVCVLLVFTHFCPTFTVCHIDNPIQTHFFLFNNSYHTLMLCEPLLFRNGSLYSALCRPLCLLDIHSLVELSDVNSWRWRQLAVTSYVQSRLTIC